MKYRIVILIAFCMLFLVQSVRADYVLPYPSYMPGNKLYTVMRVVDAIKKYWYWGNIASYKYNLEMADKKLVEAKTLFEYKQYLLAVKALQQSDTYFLKLPGYLEKAKKKGKDIRYLQTETSEAANVHLSVLNILIEELPSEFTWQPEKQSASELSIRSLLETSIATRKNVDHTAGGL